MLCDFCHKNEAVLFIEQVNVSGRKKINLCMECAVKYGLSPDPKSIEKNIGSLFTELDSKSKIVDQDTSKLCPVCGQSIASIRRTGKVGCPECYAIFGEEIKDIMKSKNIEGPYSGEMPRRLASFRSRLTDRMDIQAKLDAALKAENYEKAAMYRDCLRALEKSSVSDGNEEPFVGGGDNEQK